MTVRKSTTKRSCVFAPFPLAWFLLCCATAAILFGKGLATPDIETAPRTESRSIEYVKAGDHVWAYDTSLAKWEIKPVLQPLVHDYDGKIVTVLIAGTHVQATSNHPFWVVSGERLDSRPLLRDLRLTDQHAASAEGRWVEAGDLEAGDVLVLRNGGHAAIDMVTVRRAKENVYNLHIADLHTYAVADLGIVVHNTSCFPAGALVLMGDGRSKPIDQIDVGDWVLAGDPLSTGPSHPAEVTALIRDFAAGLVKVSVENSPGFESVLTPTWHHPVWTDNRGWVEAKDLAPGDMLRDPQKRSLRVTAVKAEDKPFRSYNLSVEAVHTFYAVTVDGTAVLVHNEDIIGVDPGELFLPASRPDGPDIFKLIDQWQEFKLSTQGMPPLWVTQGNNGMQILNGVTRATRANMIPGQQVPAVIQSIEDTAFTTPQIKDIMKTQPQLPSS